MSWEDQCRIEEQIKVPLQERIDAAVEVAFDYGQIDGDHHKMWVIDQMIKILLGEDYGWKVAQACKGEDGPETYAWDTGIAP